MGLKIDYQIIESTVGAINNTINGSNVVADYTALLNGFTESKGKQAEAIRALLREEQALAKQLDTTLRKFGNKIQSATNNFKQIDRGMARKINNR